MICASIRPDEVVFFCCCFETSVEGCKFSREAALRPVSKIIIIHEPYHRKKSIFGVCTVYSEMTAFCFIDLKITHYVLVRSNVVFFCCCCYCKQLICRTELQTEDRKAFSDVARQKSIASSCVLLFSAFGLFNHTKKMTVGLVCWKANVRNQ